MLCHRDYHSRNLMLCAGELYIIDFQDARMGPDTYDLASLLRDSYVDLPEEDSRELIDHFIALKREGSPETATAEWEHAFRDRFEMMALQRNLKALGTFGLPDHGPEQPRVHAVHPAHAPLREHRARAPAAIRADCVSCWPA